MKSRRVSLLRHVTVIRVLETCNKIYSKNPREGMKVVDGVTGGKSNRIKQKWIYLNCMW
jgi:hypothetical protein